VWAGLTSTGRFDQPIEALSAMFTGDQAANASAAREAQGLRVGRVLQGTYEIVRLAGRGGMGEVYEARHLRIPGRFAVKVLHQQEHLEAEALARFRREAEITSSLRHPNIVQVLDFNQLQTGAPYLVMEFLDGVDLAQKLHVGGHANPMPPFEVIRLVGQMASGLAAAHAIGVVHRDLKPQNVFVVPMAGQAREFVKILDFGISTVKGSTSSAGANNEASIVGTPQYMSPEQATGSGSDLDGKTDQFALAAIAYEMLTGRPVFSGDDLPAILFGILHGEPLPLPGDVRAILGDSGEAVLRRALSKRRQDRYDDVLEFATALQETALWESGARTPRPMPSPQLLSLSTHAAAQVAHAPRTTSEIPERPAGLTLTVEIAHATPGPVEIGGATISTVIPAEAPTNGHAPVSRRRHQAVVAALSVVAAAGWITALAHPRRVEDSAEKLTAPLIDHVERLKVAARPNQLVYVDIVRRPPGLRAFVDGQLTALPIELPRGTAAYHLRLEAPAYQPYETWIDAVTDRELDVPMLRKSRPDPRVGARARQLGRRPPAQ
jgi:serine/threonine protein kinase